MTDEEKARQFWRELESLHCDSHCYQTAEESDTFEHIDLQLVFIERHIKFLKDRCVSLELLVAGLFVLSLLLGIALIWKLR